MQLKVATTVDREPHSPFYLPLLSLMFSQSQLSFQTTQEDHKASYDDLIDDHAVHQTFSVETPYHKSNSSKQSGHTSHASYPPLPPTKDVDSRPFWEKVPPSFTHHTQSFLTLHTFLVPTRISCVSTLLPHSPHRNNNRLGD